MNNSEEKPWWHPRLTDAAWAQEMRETYPDQKDWTDDQLREVFADSRKYQVLWDNLRDAYRHFEALADGYMALAGFLQLAVKNGAVRIVESGFIAPAGGTVIPIPGTNKFIYIPDSTLEARGKS